MYFHGIRYDDAIIAPLGAQKIREDAARKRGRMYVVECRIKDMGRHEARRAVLHGAAKRTQFKRLQLSARSIDDRQAEMRIDMRVPVPREMLHTCGHPRRPASS